MGVRGYVKNWAKRAKKLPEFSDKKHGQLLDLISKDLGYYSWNHLCGGFDDEAEADVEKSFEEVLQKKYGRPRSQPPESA